MSARYFEDVSIGDEVPAREVLPTEDGVIDFFGRTNRFNPAFTDAKRGHEMGLGGAIVSGVMKMAWLTHHFAEWAGPEATIVSIRVAFRRPDIAGHALTLSGHVVDKRIEDGKAICELEVATITDDGQPSLRGNVQVALPTRG